jgi:CRISPR-associated protein Cas2
MILITYDVNTQDDKGKARLRKVSKACQNYGQRVQNSVFECAIDWGTFLLLKNQLLGIIDKSTDSLRFYNLGKHWNNRVEHYGAKAGYNPEGTLII